MSDTVFVTMYNPNLGNVQVDAPLQAVSTYQAHGWLLLDPNATPPPVASPYLSQPAADSRYLRDWAGAEVLTAGAVRVAPDGHVIVRTADGTTRSTYDATEQALWSSVTAGVAAVAGLTGSPTAQQIVDALATPLRAAYGLSVVTTVTASAALAVGKFTPVDATSAAPTMTLPTGAADGVTIGVEKVDASANAVTVSGNIRGVGSSTITLPWQHETLLLRADSSGSWWPVAGHKTKSSLDAAYASRPGGTSAVQAKLPFYNVRDFGAVGDGTTDDTAAIRAALTAASAGSRRLVVPATSSFYKVTDSLPISKAGLMIEGQGGLAQIKQVTANKNLLEINADSGYGVGIIAYVTIANLQLTGPGSSAGTGVGIWTDPTVHTPAVYKGQTIRIVNTIVEDFDIGVEFYYVDNSYAETLQIKRCRIGWTSSGGANTIHLINCAATGHTQVAYYFGDGCGVTMHGGDNISSKRMLELGSNAQVTLLGTNMENLQFSGVEFILVGSNATLTSIGTRFALDAISSGIDATRYRANAGSRLTVIAPQDDSTATTPLITKADSTAMAYLWAPNTGLSSGGSSILDGTLSRGTVFDMRQDNSVPAASQLLRGGTIEVVGRDAVTAEDRLVHFIRRYNGTTNTFEAVDLTDPRAFYSTSGAAGSRVDGVRHHIGRTPFTTSAATSTTVTVTVGAFTQLYSATATVSVEGGTPTGPVSVVYKTNSAGVLTFVVFHPNDTAGSLAWRLMYKIDVGT